ncbi:peptidase [Ramlibacter sp. G-1-2-2]|uniref:Peptidase n=1 Tax=Ramlibacter agri TaxID=2728837 RepID=A0A848H2P8_9BURK|nr:peptidase [Ramlibacter agri]
MEPSLNRATTLSGPAATASSTAIRPPLSARALLWLRKTHGWIGLWGAVLGLLFGMAGFWLNHRAVMKIPTSQLREHAQIAVPDPAPATPADMAGWLRGALQQGRDANVTRVEPARKLQWQQADGQPITQPEHWIFTFGGPDRMVQADYWKGNRSVGVNVTNNGFAATIANMHKGVGMPAAWILLVDTLVGSLIFLSVSGVAMWLLMNKRNRRAGLVVLGSSVALTAGLIAWALAA